MIRVSAKSRGLTSVADLTKAKGREADALRSVDELDLSNNAIDSLLSAFDSDQGTNDSAGTSSSALAALSSLKHLDLHKNRLSKTSLLGLEVLASHLTHLNVADNSLESLQGLRECRQLTFLDVSRNRIRHMKGLPKLVNDAELYVAAASFTLRASGNLCSSAGALEADLSSTIGAVLTDLDVSLNRLDAVPMHLLFEDPPHALSLKTTVSFPRLAHVKLDCNPFLINGAMDQCCEALLLARVEQGALGTQDATDLVRSKGCVACAQLVCPSDTRVVEANGRQPSQEASWRSVAIKRLGTIRNRGALPAPHEQPQPKDHRASTVCDDTSDLQSASQEVRVRGEGRVSAFGAVPTSTRSSASSILRDSAEDNAALSRSLSASAMSSRSASAVVVDASVQQQAMDSMRIEHRQLKRELVDSKRVIRDQVQSIRRLQDEQQSNLAMIHDLQDKLKRKSTELQCTLRRAHEAEARVVALGEKENDSMQALSMPDLSGHNATTASSCSISSNVPPQQRSFHLSDEERAHIIEQRALSKLSSSFDKHGHLLSGRYAHAHRTYVYGKDLNTPSDEQIRLRNIEAKHNIEHVVGRGAAQRRIRQSLGMVQHQQGPALDTRGQHHDPLQQPYDNYEGPHAALDPQDEAILFLSERVAQLEAMYATQTSYCDDLSKENDDLIAKYERLIATSAASQSTSVVSDHQNSLRPIEG